MRVPWVARRLNQSILKEINPEYSLGGLILKMQLQSFGHLMRRADLVGKTLMLGKIEGKMRSGWQRMRWLDGITDSVIPSNYLIPFHLLLFLPSIFSSIRVFCNESALCIRWPKFWSFSISPYNEYSGLTSFSIDWFDLLF